MVRVKSIWYGKSFYNGDKEDEKITVQVDLSQDDQNKVMAVYHQLKDLVNTMHKEG